MSFQNMIQPFAHEMFSALAQGGTWQAQRTYYHSIHLFLSFHWPRAEESRSISCLRLRLRKIIDLLSTDTKSSRYLAQPRPISRTISFSNLSITQTKSFSLPVEHCNFTPDFSNSPIFRTTFNFFSLGGSKNRDSTVHWKRFVTVCSS